MISSEESEITFSQDRLDRLTGMEKWHFWFVSRRRMVFRLLSKWQPTDAPCILDMGCGSGYMVRELNRHGYRAYGADGRREGLIITNSSLPSPGLVHANVQHLPVLTQKVDMVLLLDVLEHVDDSHVVSEAFRILNPSGVVILTVPALPWLWSHRDDAAGHRRRYTKKTLRAVLKNAGFSVRLVRYYQFFTLPIVVVMRFSARRSPAICGAEERPNTAINRMLTSIINLEVFLGQWFEWPIGSSLVAVCEKKGA